MARGSVSHWWAVHPLFAATVMSSTVVSSDVVSSDVVSSDVVSSDVVSSDVFSSVPTDRCARVRTTPQT